jgi:hypothetical protein
MKNIKCKFNDNIRVITIIALFHILLFTTAHASCKLKFG